MDEWMDGYFEGGRANLYMYLAAPLSCRKSSPGPTFWEDQQCKQQQAMQASRGGEKRSAGFDGMWGWNVWGWSDAVVGWVGVVVVMMVMVVMVVMVVLMAEIVDARRRQSLALEREMADSNSNSSGNERKRQRQ